MPTILITGASSGLGAAFLTHYSLIPSNTIYTLDINPLPTTFSANSRITHSVIDTTNTNDIATLAHHLQDIPIDLLIHSAGIRGLVPSLEDAYPNDVAACETLEVMDEATMLRTFQINTIGTFSLLRALLPNLRASQNSKVIVMSSRMGSVSSNVSGAGYAYRASKAALNAVIESFSLDVPEVTFVLNHPGRVETGLVRCKEEGAISAEESVKGLVVLIEKWNRSDSGKFYDRFGDVIACDFDPNDGNVGIGPV